MSDKWHWEKVQQEGSIDEYTLIGPDVLCRYWENNKATHALLLEAAPAMAALLRMELESLDHWLQDQSCSDETLGEMLVREDEIQKLLKDLEG